MSDSDNTDGSDIDIFPSGLKTALLAGAVCFLCIFALGFIAGFAWVRFF